MTFHMEIKKKRLKVAQPKQPKAGRIKLDSISEPPMGLIQGKTPGSLGEWRVSLALDSLGYEYYFQYSIMGGHDVRGGQVIDFLVLTDPMPTPLFYNGDYWHTGQKGMDDAYKIFQVKKYMKGQILEPVIIWEKKDGVDSLERAKLIVKEKLR